MFRCNQRIPAVSIHSQINMKWSERKVSLAGLQFCQVFSMFDSPRTFTPPENKKKMAVTVFEPNVVIYSRMRVVQKVLSLI